jgi:hypothetical protein
MSDYTWTGNPWHDLNGNYYANAEDAERQRNRQRERRERDAMRKIIPDGAFGYDHGNRDADTGELVEGTDGMGMPVWCYTCTVPLTDEEADRGTTCTLCARESQHVAA